MESTPTTPTPATPQSPQSLEQARRAAKRLKKQLAAGDQDAVARFQAVFGASRSAAAASHADCLHVVAREAGAPSWPRLKLAVETAAMTRDQRIARLSRAVASGAVHVSDRLLALDPTLADAHFGLQLALARRDAVLAALAADPAVAMRPIGDRWPIHHLCYSRIHQRTPEASPVMVNLLEALIAAGADVNQGFASEPGSDHLLSPLYGALGHAGHLALAEALLRHGADPNDNESLYHATELDALDGVRLLFRHGAEIGNTNAFYRMLDRESLEGVQVFLANGAELNGRYGALHHAILRGRSAEIGACLIDHGADLSARLGGRTPYALAMIHGNWPMADLLAARGADTTLGDTERLLALIARADGDGARRLLAEQPSLRESLTDRDLSRQTQFAMVADKLPVLRLLAELGFDPNRRGESGMPPIHAAAWWGLAEIVEMYIGLGVDLEIENMYGGRTLGAAIHGSMNCPGREHGDYLRCVRSLVDAGARIRPDEGHLDEGTEEISLFVEGWLEASADRP